MGCTSSLPATNPHVPEAHHPLWRAVAQGDRDVVDRLLAAASSPHAVQVEDSRTGVTPLMVAASMGHASGLKDVLQKVKKTPPSVARFVVILAKLLEAGADLHRTDRHGRTALMHAVRAGPAALLQVKALVFRGASLDAKDTKGRTALHYAAIAPHIGALEYLLKWGADPDVRDDQGHTAIQLAAQEGCHDAVRLLQLAGADTKSTTSDDKPLQAVLDGPAAVTLVF